MSAIVVLYDKVKKSTAAIQLMPGRRRGGQLSTNLFESISFVDNLGAAGSKIVISELGQDTGPRFHIDSEALAGYMSLWLPALT